MKTHYQQLEENLKRCRVAGPSSTVTEKAGKQQWNASYTLLMNKHRLNRAKHLRGDGRAEPQLVHQPSIV